jgi:hypothetical protein
LKEFAKEIFTPRSQYQLKEYRGQEETVIKYISLLYNPTKNLMVLKGEKGSGVTHLLHAGANKIKLSKHKVCVITAEWIVQMCKVSTSVQKKKEIQRFFLKHDAVFIDNLQFFYRKSSAYLDFLKEIVDELLAKNKKVILGCSDKTKDVTKSKKFKFSIPFKRLRLKSSSSLSVFKILKNLCSAEDNIPDHLIYLISGYNGTAQQYINCLVSIRFKSKLDEIDLTHLSAEDLESRFNIRSYFPQQQLRKHLLQKSIVFKDAYLKLIDKKGVRVFNH